MLTVASLTPDQFRIDLKAKIIELVISLETRHEQSGSPVHIYEYLVGDETGCVILNTKSGMYSEIACTFISGPNTIV
ncbi:hypothetical protein [Parasitella parasitica]|uniref:Uncharacterized protein n=1 Tax=Parasitella parasitica TaxID=35722 RepID=A0A0B7NFT9_9FUNG|nr:hypothetical protein [Parasitella parasitica]